MKNVLLILLSALFLLPACNSHSHHEGTEAAVQLDDNGQRWIANPETTAGIAQMQAILEKYDGQNGGAIREELEAAFQDIFRQCTMKGEAHDQLHNYLMPMKGLMEQTGSDDAAASRAAAESLKAHLSEYSTYFQ